MAGTLEAHCAALEGALKQETRVSEAEIGALTERIHAMHEEDRAALDPICEALRTCWRRERPGAMVLPNRVVALACLDLAKRFHATIMQRE